jgi:hypothetical protein
LASGNFTGGSRLSWVVSWCVARRLGPGLDEDVYSAILRWGETRGGWCVAYGWRALGVVHGAREAPHQGGL